MHSIWTSQNWTHKLLKQIRENRLAGMSNHLRSFRKQKIIVEDLPILTQEELTPSLQGSGIFRNQITDSEKMHKKRLRKTGGTDLLPDSARAFLRVLKRPVVVTIRCFLRLKLIFEASREPYWLFAALWFSEVSNLFLRDSKTLFAPQKVSERTFSGRNECSTTGIGANTLFTRIQGSYFLPIKNIFQKKVWCYWVWISFWTRRTLPCELLAG